MEPGAVDLIVRGRRVLTPDGFREAAVHVEGGVVTALTPYTAGRAREEVEAGDDAVVVPGLVDTHVHVNEPGRTEWEGFETATRAAAAGGVTTLVDMPLNSIPPTTTLAALEAKRAAAAPHCWVDVGTWGGVVPGNTAELAPMHRAGVPGFKCFLVPSGVEEFPHVEERHLREALPVLAELGSTLLVHAELAGPIERAERDLACDGRRYGCYLSSRPAEAERKAVALLAALCRETGARIHVVHLACGDAVELVREARAQGLPLSAETCPHYLTIDATEVADGATAFKCAPPIRERDHADALWAGLEQGVLDMVVTDHSPCPPELKRRGDGDFLAAWGGISSLQLGFAATWTEARRRGIALEQVVRWMTAGPARLAGLAHRKGAIAPGRDADLTVLAPDATLTVEGASLEHRHGLTAYEGTELAGVVRATYLRGRRIYHEGRFADGPRGHLIGADA